MPHSSQNVTPYFPILLKQLFPVQCNRSLIGDTKQRRLNNKQPTRMSWNDVSARVEKSDCHRQLFVQFVCQLKLKRGFVFFKNLPQLITANKRKHTHTSCTAAAAVPRRKSNLLHGDKKGSEATVFPPLPHFRISAFVHLLICLFLFLSAPPPPPS